MKPRRELKVGDRVRVKTTHSEHWTDRVVEIKRGLYRLEQGGINNLYERSVLTPLIPKKRPKREEREPIELWVNVYPNPQGFGLTHLKKEYADKAAKKDRIHVARLVEIPEGSVVVDIGQLKTALGNMFAMYLPKEWKADTEKVLLNCFLDHFGLEAPNAAG